MKTILIEDEKPSARRLERMLEKLNIGVAAKLHSVDQSIDWLLENEEPDLIFLDVQLSDGLSFEIFEAVSVKSAIIFTTAYDEYAIKAFKLNSVDYLLKPIDEDELKVAVEKFKESFGKLEPVQQQIEDLQSLLLQNAQQPRYKKRFVTKVGTQLKMIPSAEAVCFYSQDKATYVYTQQQRSYWLEQSLEQLETLLDPAMFFRVSRQYFVHINGIKDIHTYSNSRLKIQLAHGDFNNIIVSRERVKDFKNWLGG